MSFQITSSSVPIYDGWGFSDYWQASDWSQWYLDMYQDLGLTTAQQDFITYWNNAPFDAASYGWLSNDPGFIQFVTQNELLQQLNTGSAIEQVAAKVGNNVVNYATTVATDTEDIITGTLGTVGKAITAVGDSVSAAGNVVKYGLYGAAGLALLIGAIIVYQKVKSV